MTKNYMPNPLLPLKRREHRPITAEVLRRLIAVQEAGRSKTYGCRFHRGVAVLHLVPMEKNRCQSALYSSCGAQGHHGCKSVQSAAARRT